MLISETDTIPPNSPEPRKNLDLLSPDRFKVLSEAPHLRMNRQNSFQQQQSFIRIESFARLNSGFAISQAQSASSPEEEEKQSRVSKS